jgi:hypothetical protein
VLLDGRDVLFPNISESAGVAFCYDCRDNRGGMMSIIINDVTYRTTDDALALILNDIEGLIVIERNRQAQLVQELQYARREYRLRKGPPLPDGPFTSGKPAFAAKPYIGLLAGTDDTFVITGTHGDEIYRARVSAVPDGRSPLSFVGDLTRHVRAKLNELLTWQETSSAYRSELDYLNNS